MSSARMDRRTFVSALAAAGGSVAAGGLISGCASDSPHDHGAMTGPVLARKGGGGNGGGAVQRNPLRIPNTVDGIDGFQLTAAPGTAGVLPDKTTSALLYNGQFPGPTLVARSGTDYRDVQFVNGLNQESIVHWHGLLVEPENDGHPRDVIPPGFSKTYRIHTHQRAGLNWYHPHPHMHTGEQVYHGLAGAFILRDSDDDGRGGKGLPSGDFEIPLIIRDASFDSRGNFRFSNKSSGFWGDTPLVNGTFSPYLEVAPCVYRFRLLNGCNARVLRLALGDGTPFTLIGNDGGLLDAVQTAGEIVAAPGERLDILLDFSGLEPKQGILLRDLDAGWDVLEFRGASDAAAPVSGAVLPDPDTYLSTIEPLADPQEVRRFTFDGMTRINGKVYDIDAIEFEVPFDTTEQWTFVTNGNGPHPVHVHGAAFQVIGRTGGRGQVYPWERGWKDTVLVNDGETVDVLIRFTAHAGLYIMHCHQLAHEDAGMMANFMVV